MLEQSHFFHSHHWPSGRLLTQPQLEEVRSFNTVYLSLFVVVTCHPRALCLLCVVNQF